MKRMKWQATEKMLVMHISNKRLKAELLKNSYKTIKKRQAPQ